MAGSKATHTHRSWALSRKVILRQLIQLHMAQGQVLEEVRVDLFGVLARAGEPQAKRHLRLMEEQSGICNRQAQVDGQEDLSNLGRWGAETIQPMALPTYRLPEQIA